MREGRVRDRSKKDSKSGLKECMDGSICQDAGGLELSNQDNF